MKEFFDCWSNSYSLTGSNSLGVDLVVKFLTLWFDVRIGSASFLTIAERITFEPWLYSEGLSSLWFLINILFYIGVKPLIAELESIIEGLKLFDRVLILELSDITEADIADILSSKAPYALIWASTACSFCLAWYAMFASSSAFNEWIWFSRS